MCTFKLTVSDTAVSNLCSRAEVVWAVSTCGPVEMGAVWVTAARLTPWFPPPSLSQLVHSHTREDLPTFRYDLKQKPAQ